MKKYHIHILKKHKKSVVLKGNIFIALYQLLRNDNTTTTIQISDLYSRKNKSKKASENLFDAANSKKQVKPTVIYTLDERAKQILVKSGCKDMGNGYFEIK